MSRIAAVLAFVLVLTGAQAAEPVPSYRVAWNEPSEPFHIIGNIYYVGTVELAVMLVATPEGHILIDGGMPESVPQIEKNIAALGFKLSDVKYLLLTHAHFDHMGGLAQLKRDSGAQLVVSVGDTPYVEQGYKDFGRTAFVKVPPAHVDRQIGDGETIELGGVTLTAHLTPGITPGCTSWTMPVTENGVRHEVIFYGSTTLGGNPLVNNTRYPQIVADYRHSFALLKAIKADVFLAPHAGFFNAQRKAAQAKAGEPNPFVVPGELQHFVEGTQRSFEAELAKQQAAAKP